MHKPSEYLMIEAWCRYLGSNNGYTKQQMLQASRDGAPLDAIYPKNGYGNWVTLSEVPEEHTFRKWHSNVRSPFTGKTS